jgi:hypothetical protein
MNNPMDYVKIMVITWLAVYAIDKALAAAGLQSFAATTAGKSAA